jgi:hypothetical protein
MPQRGQNPRITIAERQERWERCAGYLRKAGNLNGARKLARAEGWGANTSVWVSALSKMLAGKL